jgi:hypothetical protein
MNLRFNKNEIEKENKNFENMYLNNKSKIEKLSLRNLYLTKKTTSLFDESDFSDNLFDSNFKTKENFLKNFSNFFGNSLKSLKLENFDLNFNCDYFPKLTKLTFINCSLYKKDIFSDSSVDTNIKNLKKLKIKSCYPVIIQGFDFSNSNLNILKLEDNLIQKKNFKFLKSVKNLKIEKKNFFLNKIKYLKNLKNLRKIEILESFPESEEKKKQLKIFFNDFKNLEIIVHNGLKSIK